MKKSLAILFLIYMLLLIFACTQDPEGPTNTPPFLSRVEIDPDSTTPGGLVLLTSVADDPDLGDSLYYLWESEYGDLLDPVNTASVTWTAPSQLGDYDIMVTVLDTSGETDADTVTVRVYLDLSVDILTPVTESSYAPGDSIYFSGKVNGYDNLDIENFDIKWESDIDGLLDTSSVDTTGRTSFSTSLSYNIHRISLTATINDSLTASDTITVQNTIPEPVTLYDIERGYTFNRLTWTQFNDTQHFGAYDIYRRETETGDFELIDRIESVSDTVYVDQGITIGRFYRYYVRAMNDFGNGAPSNATNIISGIYSDFPGIGLGDMIFANDSYYLYLTLPNDDEVEAVDVTANNLDFTIHVGDYPQGLAVDRDNNRLLVACTQDTSISIVDLDARQVVDTLHLEDKPHYLDYHEEFNRIYVTPFYNNFPFIVEESGDSVIITYIEDSRLILEDSWIKIDDNNNHLYLTEIGGYPASLYKYSIGDGIPALLVEDVHNTLGYNLHDFALMPDASAILLACESPYHVQIVSPDDFSQVGQLNTGPYPNSVAVSPDGSTIYTAQSGNVVYAWDYQSRTITASYYFDDTITRSSVLISPDGNYLVVGTYNINDLNARISIVYLNE